MSDPEPSPPPPDSSAPPDPVDDRAPDPAAAEAAPTSGASGKVVVTLGIGLLVLVIAATLVGTVVLPGVIDARKQALRMRCADNLRVLGLAATQYADDHGHFPHVSALDQLDGGPETADTPRAWRLLIAGGYADDPEQFHCPAAGRPSVPAEVRDRHLAWFTTRPPSPALEAPTLVEFERLSYGWVRRAVPLDAPGATPLAADKAVVPRRGDEVEPMSGTHTDGWNLLRADGRVEWLSVEDEPFPGEWLPAVEDPTRDGYLAVAEQEGAWRFRAVYRPTDAEGPAPTPPGGGEALPERPPVLPQSPR